MKFLSFSNILSSIALLVAALTFLLDYERWKNSFVPPEVFAVLKTVTIQFGKHNEQPFEFAVDAEFSVTNRSSEAAYIVSCQIAGAGLHIGAGGYGERYYDCGGDIETVLRTDVIKIDPGQTRFFPIRFVEELTESDLRSAAQQRGIDLRLIDSLQDKDVQRDKYDQCDLTFSSSFARGSWTQNCPAVLRNAELYSLLVQFSNEEVVRKKLVVTSSPDWPWGRF